MNDKDFLLAMYSEQVEQARQHENMRANAANIVFGAGAVVAGFLYDNDAPHGEGRMLAIGLILIGVFGVAIVAKHYERNRMHVAVAQEYRAALEERLPGSNVDRLRSQGRRTHKKAYWLLSELGLNWLWTAASLVFVMAGLHYLINVAP
jgi:hypothetical protein